MERLTEYINSLSISDVFGEYGLTIEGRKVSCPFHDETRPSLFVLETQTGNDKWFCQSCRRGGGISNFIAEYNKMFNNSTNFYSALEFYLKSHQEAWEVLDFNTLIKTSEVINNFNINEALDKLRLYEELNSSKLRGDIQLLPKDITYEAYLQYIIKIQNGGGNLW